MTKVEAAIRFAVQSQKSIYKTEEKHNEKGIINFAPALHGFCNGICGGVMRESTIEG